MGIKEGGPLTTYNLTMKPMQIAEVLVEWCCIFVASTPCIGVLELYVKGGDSGCGPDQNVEFGSCCNKGLLERRDRGM